MAEKIDLRAAVRWALLAIGVVAIFVFATNTGIADRPRSPVSVTLDPDAIEPAPLAFQPNVAPADAETINAERPDYAGPIVAAKPFIASRAPERLPDLQRATDCLTLAVYYEAASETTEGQRAVAQVVLNRARDPRYPASVCGVVFQGSERATGCQFTFTCDGALARKPDPFLFDRARRIAFAALSGHVEYAVGLATHYHTKQVVPVWRTDLVKLRTIGAHIFYGWQGSAKGVRGLRAGYAGIEPVIFPVPTAAESEAAVPADALTSTTNPFVAPPPQPAPDAPQLPMQDFGRMEADDKAGQLIIGPVRGLDADTRSGTLERR